MKLTDLLPIFTPLRLSLLALAATTAVGGVAYVRHLQNAVKDAKAEAEAQADNAAARALEASGEAAQAQRVEIVVRQPTRASEAALAPIITQARSAPDANAPLDPDRLARLHTADRSLCEQSPGLDGCSAEAERTTRGG